MFKGKKIPLDSILPSLSYSGASGGRCYFTTDFLVPVPLLSICSFLVPVPEMCLCSSGPCVRLQYNWCSLVLVPKMCWCSGGLWCRCNRIGALWCWCYSNAIAVELPTIGSMTVLLYQCSLVLVPLKVLRQWCFSGAGAILMPLHWSSQVP
jgi:hypothetical protein